MKLVGRSRIQYSRIALYWAPLTVAFSILWTVVINLLGLSGLLSAFSLIGPMLLGALSSTALYFMHDYRTLEYDDQGYQEKIGGKFSEPHKWSEFKECSVVKDGYGRQKVRVYFERDGSHHDIDSSACGLDPYSFRDFASSRISSSIPEERSSDFIGGLERELQRGRTQWVADLNESFRDYQVSGEVFSLLARGGSRPKGFLLSRMMSYMVMPNYNVCMYVQRLDGSRAKEHIMRLLRVIETQRDERDIKWSWLLLLGDEPAPESANKLIKQFGNRDIGLGYVNTLSGETSTSPNQLGRSMANQMRLNRLTADLRRRKYSGF
jgi:hypothetical protein